MAMKRRVVLRQPSSDKHNRHPSDASRDDAGDAVAVASADELGTCVVDLSAMRSYTGKEPLVGGGRASQGNTAIIGGGDRGRMQERESSRPGIGLPPLALSSPDPQLTTSIELSGSQQSGIPAATLASRIGSLPRAANTSPPSSVPLEDGGHESPSATGTTSPQNLLQQPFNISFGLASVDNSASFAVAPTLHTAHASPTGAQRQSLRGQLRAIPGLSEPEGGGGRQQHIDPFMASALEHPNVGPSSGTGCNKRMNVSLQVVPCTITAASTVPTGGDAKNNKAVTAAIRLLRIPKACLGHNGGSATCLLTDIVDAVYHHACLWSDFDHMPDTCEAAGVDLVATRSGSLAASPSRTSQETYVLKHRLSSTMNEAPVAVKADHASQELHRVPSSSAGFADTAPPALPLDDSTFLHVTHVMSLESEQPPGSALTVAGVSAVFASPLIADPHGPAVDAEGETYANDGSASPPPLHPSTGGDTAAEPAATTSSPPAAAPGPLCALPVLSVTFEIAPPSTALAGDGGDACLIVAQPFIGNGNILDRYQSWLRHSHPSFVEREVAIRHILRSCLWQLVQLHRRGEVHGSVKATNMFAWSDVKAATAAWVPEASSPSRNAANSSGMSPGLTVVTTDKGAGDGGRRGSQRRSSRGSKSFRGGADTGLEWVDDVILVDGAYHRIRAIVEAKLAEHLAARDPDPPVATSNPSSAEACPTVSFDITKHDYVLPPECLQRARTQLPSADAEPSWLQQRPRGGSAAPATAFTMSELAPAANACTAAADLWGLGLAAIHLADGGFPSWLHRQAKPVPSLSNTAWSHKFASFVQVCVSLQPEHRTTAEALLDDPWFHSVISAPPPNDNDLDLNVGQNVAILQQRPSSCGESASVGGLQRFANNTSFGDVLAASGGAGGGGASMTTIGGGAAAGAQGAFGLPSPASPSSVSRPLRHLFDFTSDGRVFVPQKNYMRTFADMELSCLQYVLATKRPPPTTHNRIADARGGAHGAQASNDGRPTQLQQPTPSAAHATAASTESRSGPKQFTPRPRESLQGEDDAGVDDSHSTGSSRNPLETTKVGVDRVATSASTSARTSTARNESGTKRFSVAEDTFNQDDDNEGVSLAWAPLPRLAKSNKPPFLASFLAAMEACRRDLLVDCGYYVASGKHVHPADEVVLTLSGTPPTAAQRREVELIDHRIAGLVQAFLELYNVAPICGDHWMLSVLDNMRKHPATQDIIEPVIRCWKKQVQSRLLPAAAGVACTTTTASSNSGGSPTNTGGGAAGGGPALRGDPTTSTTGSKHTNPSSVASTAPVDAQPSDFNNYLFSKWLVLGALTVQERR